MNDAPLFDDNHAFTLEHWDKFFDAYLTTALWSSTDDNDEPLDANYCTHDIVDDDRAEEDCDAFIAACNAVGLARVIAADPALAGHHFWLTRNHHGAGFWDGAWGEHGDALTEICQDFPEVDPYVGDDGGIHFR